MKVKVRRTNPFVACFNKHLIDVNLISRKEVCQNGGFLVRAFLGG